MYEYMIGSTVVLGSTEEWQVYLHVANSRYHPASFDYTDQAGHSDFEVWDGPNLSLFSCSVVLKGYTSPFSFHTDLRYPIAEKKKITDLLSLEEV